jgi:hypothetical protein
MILPRATNMFSNQSIYQPPFTTLVPGNLYLLAFISFALILELFLVLQVRICSNFKIPEPHSLYSVFPTAPLCSRDGDGRHFERTAERRHGVRPGCQQVRDGSVLRWILYAAVGYTDILTWHVESHRYSSSWHPAVYISPLLQPITQWHHFTNSI